MDEKLNQTVFFEIRDEDDARRICEILAMNGYPVKAVVDKCSYKLLYLVYVQEKEMA